MGQLQAWSNEASLESKVLAALAKRADVEAAGHRFDGGHTGSLRARSSNPGGFASRSESMSSLAGHPDLHSEHHPEHPEKQHGQPARPTGCCLAAIATLLVVVGLVLLLRQRDGPASPPPPPLHARGAVQTRPAPLAAVTAASAATGGWRRLHAPATWHVVSHVLPGHWCCTLQARGLSRAGTRCSQLCVAEANGLLAKQPDLTEGARGAAYDACFARCAAASPADALKGMAVRRNRKVAAGGAVAVQSGGGAAQAEQQQKPGV